MKGFNQLTFVIDVINFVVKMCFLWRICMSAVSYIVIVFCFWL